MTIPDDSTRASTRPPAWLWATLGFTAVMCVIVVLRAESSTDFRDFWRTALAFRTTGKISSELGVHNYLPVFPILCTPLSLLPLQVAIVLFTLLSIATFVWTVYRLRSICNLSDDSPTLPICIGLMLPYVVSCVTLGAFGLVLLALTVEALHALLHRRDLRAGLLLGAATLLKLLPGALLVFCLLRGRWRTCLASGAVLAVIGLGLPTLLLGVDESVNQHRAFWERAVRGHSARTTIHAEKPIKANYSNNALPIVLRRLLTPLDGSKRSEDEEGWTVNVADLPLPTVWTAYVAIMAVLLAGSLYAARPGSDFVPGYAAWSALMLLASPLVWTHYLPLALLPLVLVTRVAVTPRGSIVARIAVVVWLIGALALAIPQARAAGAQYLSVLAAWLAVVWIGAASRPVEAPPSEG